MPLNATDLIVTPGSPQANAYCTLAFADAYHETSIYGAVWRSTDVPTRVRAILTATRLLDDTWMWNGYPWQYTQVLAWPRSGLLTISGGPLAFDAIPVKVQEATAELARYLVEEISPANTGIDLEAVAGLSEIKVGPLAFKFSETLTAGATSTRAIPSAIADMLRRWGYSASSTNGMTMVSVQRS